MRIIDNPDYVGAGIFYREHERFMNDPDLREAFECGRKEGWREAMREAEREGLGERRLRELPPMYRDDRTMPPMYRGGMGYRDEQERIDEQKWREYEERRRRANGQFY